MNPNDFYKFRAEAGDEPSSAELLIFSQIGDWEDMGDVSAKAFAHDLAKLPTSVKRLDIHINSPGGSVFEAQAIYSRLADHRATKIVYVDGLAASAASIVAMVGHRIFIRANANMMIHLPSGLAMGNADDMRHMATALDSITESMINVYAKKTALERDEIRSLLAAETWFSPQDAVEKGFADEIRGVVKAAAVVGDKRVVINGIEHDLSRFHNIPAFTTATIQTKTTPMSKKKITAQATEEPEEKARNGDDNGEENETPTPPVKEETPAPAPAPPPPAKSETDFDKGIKAERDRIMALQKLDKPATHAVIVAAIKDGKQVTDIVGEITDALEKATQRDARRADASALNNIPPSDAGADDDKGLGALLTKKVKARLKNRGLNTRRN
jgi:ATP-dependent protease ClpP protease subunit